MRTCLANISDRLLNTGVVVTQFLAMGRGSTFVVLSHSGNQESKHGKSHTATIPNSINYQAFYLLNRASVNYFLLNSPLSRSMLVKLHSIEKNIGMKILIHKIRIYNTLLQIILHVSVEAFRNALGPGIRDAWRFEDFVGGFRSWTATNR